MNLPMRYCQDPDVIHLGRSYIQRKQCLFLIKSKYKNHCYMILQYFKSVFRFKSGILEERIAALFKL